MMRNCLIAIVCVVAALTATAIDISTIDPKTVTKEQLAMMTKEQRQAFMKRVVAQVSGGEVVKQGSAKGVMKIISSSPVVDGNVLAADLQKLRRVVRVNVAVEKGKKASPLTAKGLLAQAKCQAAVFVVEDDALPRLLIAPEDGWAIVNVTACRADSAAAAVLETRVRKEVMRAIAFVSGSGNGNNVMRSVVSIGDLDNIAVETISLQSRVRMLDHLKNLGIEPEVVTSYRKACIEGWAPQPTNEFQKAIWDEIHKAPTAPIVIKPESQKGK